MAAMSPSMSARDCSLRFGLYLEKIEYIIKISYIPYLTPSELLPSALLLLVSDLATRLAPRACLYLDKMKPVIISHSSPLLHLLLLPNQVQTVRIETLRLGRQMATHRLGEFVLDISSFCVLITSS